MSRDQWDKFAELIGRDGVVENWEESAFRVDEEERSRDDVLGGDSGGVSWWGLLHIDLPGEDTDAREE